MKNMNLMLMTFGLLLLANGCEDYSDKDIPVDFEFRLLNENREPASIFNQEENFVFSFLIINKTEFHLRLLQSSLNQSEFFEVISLSSESTETDDLQRGKPYSEMFCDKVNGIPIPPHDTLKFELPWIPEIPWQHGVPYYDSKFCLVEHNSPLSVGKYETGFTSSFEFIYSNESLSIKEKQFYIQFEIVP